MSMIFLDLTRHLLDTDPANYADLLLLEEMSICLLESDQKISKSHANVVSFDHNVLFVNLNELI